MKRSDHILALTRALLSSPEKSFQKTLSDVKAIYELEELRKPAAVSLGAITDHEQSLESWILSLRQECIQEINFFYAAVQDQNLEPHIAAAFAGSPDLLMQVKTDKDLYTFKLETYFSPSYQITPHQFISVLEAQSDQQLVWRRVSELVLESNKLNNRTIFNPTDIVQYLQSEDGKSVFDFLAADLIKEVQIDCSIYDKPFIVPGAYQSLFVKYPPLGFEIEDREYVYLYPLRDVAAEEILTLIEAQSFEPEVWNELNKTLDSYQDETMPPLPVNQWKGKIMSLEGEMLQRIVSPICRSICQLCEDRKLKPIIPVALTDAFGPDELGQKRAAVRSKENNRWSLQSVQQPWEYYAFREVDYKRDVKLSPSDQPHITFEHALKAIRAFANKIQSPFEEAFSLALFLHSEANDLDPKKLEQQLKACSFSARAVEVLNDKLWIAEQFTELGYTLSQVKGLMAISVADVFGGMGSWSDQYVEDDPDQYQTVSAEMFEALKNYFAAIISLPHS